ncbi:MAG: CHAT domain-containing protein [Cyanobacteria bacterium P01_A01_bin.17]
MARTTLKLKISKKLSHLGYFLGGVGLVIFLNLNPGIAQTKDIQLLPLPQIFQAEATRVEVASTEDLWVQGHNHYQLGQFTDAISAWQQLERLAESQGDSLNQAVLLNHLSSAHQQLGEWSQAQAANDHSLELLTDQPGARLQLAQTLNTQGSLQLAQSEPTAALATWKRAAQIYAESGDTAGQIGSLINQAQAQQMLGLYLRARKTLAQVRETLEQQTDSNLRTTGLRSLGNTFRLVGDLEQSQATLQASLEIAQDSGSSPFASYLSLGNTAYAQQQWSGALQHYRAAAQSPNSTLRVQAQLNQLKVALNQSNQQQAEQLWPQIQAQIEALPVSRETVYSQINLGRSLVQLKQELSPRDLSWRQIAQWMTPALQQAQQLNDPRAESYALGYLGQLYEQNQQWAIAADLTQKALSLAQTANATDISYQWHWQQGRILKAQGDWVTATEAYENAFETLQALRSNLVAINPDVQFSFQQTVEPVYRDLVDLLLQPQASSQAQIQEARNVIEALQLVELENFFRSACLEGQRVAVDQVDQKNAAVLYPIVLSDRLEVILSLPQQPLRHYPVPIPQSEVESTVAQARTFFEKPYIAPEGKALSQTIYHWLIQPAEQDLAQQQIDTLVFVLDGALRNIPMAALYDGSQYLIERYSVALAPGLQLLNPRPLETQNLKILAGGLAESRHGFPALKNVRKELEQIQAAASGQVLLDQRFTRKALQDQIKGVSFPVVHLATHGEFSSSSNGTFILAYDQPIQINELNELLRNSEQTRTQPIELLVLSACRTAAGDARAALGLSGVAVQAGARSTLGSLWYLDDESGAQFIRAFYRELSQGRLNKAEALRQAQLSLLKDPDYRSPAHWAPYVLVGNWL